MLRHAITIPIFVFTIWSCDDSPTGADVSDAPDAPTMEHVEMDFSVFDQAEQSNFHSMDDPGDALQALQAIQEDSEPSPYVLAASFASFAEMYFQIMGQMPDAYFNEQMWGDPELEGDTWIWEWEYHFGNDMYFNMIVTSETIGEMRHWELRYTVQGTDHDFDNALLISSQVHLDGSGGAWQLHNFFEDEEVFVVSYELEDGITTMVEMEFDQEEDGSFLYERDGDTSSLQMWGVMGYGMSTIAWNNETGEGSIQSPGYHDGEKVCWDTDFEKTEC